VTAARQAARWLHDAVAAARLADAPDGWVVRCSTPGVGAHCTGPFADAHEAQRLADRLDAEAAEETPGVQVTVEPLYAPDGDGAR